MSITRFLKRVLFPNTYSSKAYIDYLKKNGVEIDQTSYIYSPNQTFIDIQNSFGLHFGKYCKIASGVKIINHDYSVSVCRRFFHNHVGQFRETIIGDNVFIGMNAIILPGSKIGNNTIIGAGAIVSGSFPDNCVITGNPAKVCCTLEEFYDKKKKNEYQSAVLKYKSFKKRFGRSPSLREMGNAYMWMYLPRNEENIKEYKSLFRLSGDNYDEIINDFLKSNPMFNSFEEFEKSISNDK